jgi:hypothetical protein
MAMPAAPAGRPTTRFWSALADELHDTCDISDELWPALRAAFEDEAILELLLLAGYYRTVGYLANSLRLPLEPDVCRPFPVA